MSAKANTELETQIPFVILPIPVSLLGEQRGREECYADNSEDYRQSFSHSSVLSICQRISRAQRFNAAAAENPSAGEPPRLKQTDLSESSSQHSGR